LPPLSRLQAIITVGGLSSAPWTFEGKHERLENRTLRYPGDRAQFKAFAQLGLLEVESVQLGDVAIPVELAVPGQTTAKQARRRGFTIEERVVLLEWEIDSRRLSPALASGSETEPLRKGRCKSRGCSKRRLEPKMNRENLAALVHVLTWLAVIALSLATRIDIPLPTAVVKLLGWLIFMLGMFLFAWAAFYLKGAFFGNVEPVSDKLITTGPYRFVRHPVYLCMIVSTIGLTIGLRSPWGLAGVFLLFTPTGIYRARLEESAMARRFGEEWDDYVKRTCFMFPPLC
jgi:protein-S-isoprenylcysteine O-methyltransferase Ste14